MRNFYLSFLRQPVRQVPDGGSGGGNPPLTDPPPADDPPSQKWWEQSAFGDPARQYLTAKGLTLDDPLAAMPKLVDIASNAEKRIGKGLDSIIDKPGKDQPFADWARANAAALGLPEKEDGYTVTPPDTWPKDMPWNGDLEGKARKLAFDMGVPPEAHKAYVGLFAEEMRRISDAAGADFETAREQMLVDLSKDFGDQTPAVIARARQAASIVAEKAGLSAEGLEAVSHLLSDKAGDAGVIRLFAAIGELAGEDSLVGRSLGAPLGQTPADARAELQKMMAPGGDWYEASAAGNLAKLKELKPRFDQLSKLAAR